MSSPIPVISRLLLRPVAKNLRTASAFATHYLLFREQRRRRSPFYRHYRYQGRHSLRSVDGYSVIDLDAGFLFQRIPKAANSVLAASIVRYRDREPLAEGSHDAMKAVRAGFRVPSSLSADEVRHVDSLYKFVIVRDPYHRVLSAYLSKVQKQRWPKRATKPRVERARAPDWTSAPRFAEFCDYLADGGLYFNGHWSPQVDYLLFPLEAYDYIGHVETLDRDFNAICTRLFGPGDYPLLREDSRHATGATQCIDKYYTPRLRGLIRDLYARDFEAFGY